MSLDRKRQEINALDEELLEKLNRRLALALEIGAEKKKAGESIYDPAREEAIIAALKGKNSGPIGNEMLEMLFREIFSISRQAQQPMKVAFLGPEATFTHSAALKHFGSSADYAGFVSIKDVFNAVEKGEADYGVVPVENSIGGSVSYTYDMFMSSPLNIVAEVRDEIRHNLISKYRLQDIEKVYSHPMAVAQCREWLSKNLPDAEIIEVSSTAASVEAAKLYINSAGIGSEHAASHYGLGIVARNIQDKANNVTRFLVIGKARPKRAPKCKTSIMFTAKNEPGSLFKVLEPLKRHGINMTKIESRPGNTRNWDYVFFVDFQGFAEDKEQAKALKEMQANTGFLRVLGSYPEKAD